MPELARRAIEVAVHDGLDLRSKQRPPDFAGGERLALVVPRRPGISEAWLDRHAESIRHMLAGLATFEPPSPDWLEELPYVRLGPKAPLLKRYGIGRLSSITAGGSARSGLSELGATGAVIHYANFLDLLGGPGEMLPDIATVVYVHGFDITWSRLPWCPIPYKSMGNTRAYVDRLIRHSEKVIFAANSEHSRQHLINSGFPEDRVKVCYLPVEVRSSSSTVRTHVGSGPLKLLYVGRFVDFKGPVESVRAVATAQSRGVNVEFTMIGDGPLRQDVEGLIKELGAESFIHLAGSMPNHQVHDKLQNSDAFLLHNKVARKTGQVEAFGYAHAEALSNGVPVLTATAGAPSEYLDHGVNSLLVEPGDIHGQAEMIQYLASDLDLRLSLSRSAIETTERLFSPAAHALRIAELVDEARRCD